jgi:iron(III) transport system permease protein
VGGTAGLLLATASLFAHDTRLQGMGLVAASSAGLAGLLGSGFTIGATGWSFEVLNACSVTCRPASPAWAGRRARAAGAADVAGRRRGAAGLLQGDLFVAGRGGAVRRLLLLFVALPVAKSLIGAFLDDAGAGSLAALAERLGHERVWGLGCLWAACAAAWPGTRCSWRLLTATGTTVLGTLIALMAERGRRAARGR